ncbi:SH3 domain-containing protein [Pseudanabaena sp. FACHB-2040]|uniref:SH3 domain-containing protein n=1 Tax=Pseudanabaena sp. FACHB-2040 TaxID=2692859 RepID=UPI0016843F6D|nr:SH3 domain-containing protein [Pseudanabaena sp. FACHB-2040]MBD2261165.1 SH3 domain-containing protein [Pseudanabaena sp. FACHB-2040]
MHLENIGLHALFVSAALVAVEASATPGAAASVPAKITEFTQAVETPLLAQAESCRQVSLPGGSLVVQTDPTVYSESVGVVPNSSNVTIQGLGTDGWVPIIAPLEGYVPSEYLVACDPSLTTPEPALRVANEDGLCRMVVAREGLNIRNEPSISGDRIGGLRNGTMVTVEGPGAEGWVEIVEPFSGYVSANYLTACP